MSALIGHARLLRTKATRAPTSNGTSHDGDFHPGVRSYISKGDSSPKLKRVTRPSATLPDNRSLPPSSRQTNGAISRHFPGTPAGLTTADTLIVPSGFALTFASPNKFNRLMKFVSTRRETV